MTPRVALAAIAGLMALPALAQDRADIERTALGTDAGGSQFIGDELAAPDEPPVRRLDFRLARIDCKIHRRPFSSSRERGGSGRGSVGERQPRP